MQSGACVIQFRAGGKVVVGKGGESELFRSGRETTEKRELKKKNPRQNHLVQNVTDVVYFFSRTQIVPSFYEFKYLIRSIKPRWTGIIKRNTPGEIDYYVLRTQKIQSTKK